MVYVLAITRWLTGKLLRKERLDHAEKKTQTVARHQMYTGSLFVKSISEVNV